MKKIIIKKIIKTLGLLSCFENINFSYQKYKNRKSNIDFKQNHPEILLPPDYYMYETFNVNYNKFYNGGIDAASWIINHLNEFIKFKNKVILDWGCGPGRILRHLPSMIDSSNKVFGTDYNIDYVNWCNNNLKEIIVKKNNLEPPLSFKDNYFDVIYGVSIFTHLSEKMHINWMKEINRVLNSKGVLFLTTHGNSFKNKLTKYEAKSFDEGQLIVHDYKKEGNRLFASYQPESFFKELIRTNNFKILRHIKGEIKNEKPQQDIWIITKL